MGCNCGSNAAKVARAQIISQPTVSPSIPAVMASNNDADRVAAQKAAMAERIDYRKDDTICPVCRKEITYRLEFQRNQWVRVKWCKQCGVRLNVL